MSTDNEADFAVYDRLFTPGLLTFEDQLVAIGALEAAINRGQKLSVGAAYDNLNGGECSCAVIGHAFGYVRHGTDHDPYDLYDFLAKRHFNVRAIHQANDSDVYEDTDGPWPQYRRVGYGGFEAAIEAVKAMTVEVP